jgi:hypothetical protein
MHIVERTDDIRQAHEIVKDMDDLRAKNLTDAKSLDQYLNLTNELAGLVRANTSAVERTKRIGAAIQKDRALITYDARQDTYWRRRDPALITELDLLTISMMQENLQSMDSKHHFFQTAKYLTALPQQKEMIFDSIVPVHKAVTRTRQDISSRIGDSLLGSNYEVVSDDRVQLSVRGDARFVPELIAEARDRGYASLSVIVDAAQRERIKALGGREDDQLSTPLPRWMTRLYGKSRLLGNIVMGGMPYEIQYRMENATTGRKHYRMDRGHGISVATGFGLGVAGTVALSIDLASANYLWLMAPVAVNSIIRMLSVSEGSYAYSSIFTKPFMIPLERRLKRGERKFRFDFTQQAKRYDDTALRQSYLAAMDSRSTDEERDSLAWKAGNHHQFGQSFMQRMTTLNLKPVLRKQDSAATCAETRDIGGYHKHNILFSYSSGDCMVTAITSDPQPGLMDIAARTLGQGLDLKLLVPQIVTATGAQYLRAERSEGDVYEVKP